MNSISCHASRVSVAREGSRSFKFSAMSLIGVLKERSLGDVSRKLGHT